MSQSNDFKLSYAGFLTMASVLVVQSLFFADCGLMALGCNIFNLGFALKRRKKTNGLNVL